MSTCIDSIASTAALQNAARSLSDRRCHDACALAAAVSACSTCVASARSRSTYTRPSTGEISCTFAVMMFSVALETALQFPIGDSPVVLFLFPLGGMHVMLDHLIAERLAQHA
ncbi:hypothetical protein D3C84_875700 [compost metagenome]